MCLLKILKRANIETGYRFTISVIVTLLKCRYILTFLLILSSHSVNIPHIQYTVVGYKDIHIEHKFWNGPMAIHIITGPISLLLMSEIKVAFHLKF